MCWCEHGQLKTPSVSVLRPYGMQSHALHGSLGAFSALTHILR